jgi:hypothetical protein
MVDLALWVLAIPTRDTCLPAVTARNRNFEFSLIMTAD